MYHCARHDANNIPELNEAPDKSNKEEKKAKHKLWHTLVGNGILNRTELQTKLVNNLLCLCCMQEQLKSVECVEDFCLDNAMLVVMTSNVGFACTLLIKCIHGNHQFTVEPLQVPSATKVDVAPTQPDEENCTTEQPDNSGANTGDMPHIINTDGSMATSDTDTNEVLQNSDALSQKK